MYSLERYSRHMMLPEIGSDGQENICRTRILIAGAGALGSMISMLAARAGVGFIRIVDRDCPELHNLQRQLLYTEKDLSSGVSKAQAAHDHLLESNSSIEIDARRLEINADNIKDLTSDVDLVLDALDNSNTRFLVNDICLENGKPYVFGGAVQTIGNIMTILPGSPCLRCLWPDPTKVADHATAAQYGVLAPITTVIASIQFTEALKIMVHKTEDLFKGMLLIDLWRGEFNLIPIQQREGCMCRSENSL